MKKKIYLFCLLLVSTIVASIVWKFVHFPISDAVDYRGEYLEKNYSSSNDTIRFFLFILISLVPFLLTYLYTYKNDNYSLKEIFFIQENREKNTITPEVNYILGFFLICIFLQFLLIEFEELISPLDIFHEGLYLTSSMNYLDTNNFWTSSYIDRGMYGNFFPLIVWKINSSISIGSARLFELFLVLSYKIFLLFLAKQIADNVNFDKLKKILFFTILVIIFLSMSNYTDSRPYLRNGMTLLFLNIFFISLKYTHKFNFFSFSLGAFSLISMIWFVDVGAYINILIFLIIFFFLIKKKYKFVVSILLGAIFAWSIFYIILPVNEFQYFISNTLNIFLKMDQLHGLIHPVPFFSDDSRATKNLIFFVITGVFVINICFDKSNNVSNNGKIFFIFFYLLALIVYKSGLSRSDSGHISEASETVILLLSTFTLYFFFNFLKQKKIKMNFLRLNEKYIKVVSTVTILLLIIFNFGLNKIQNINTSFVKINKLLDASDREFLSSGDFDGSKSEFASNEYNSLINYYKKLTKNEKCVQIFTDEVAIPYLLRKKSCTIYYQIIVAEPSLIQDNFINQLKIKRPKIILYKSERFSWIETDKRLILVNTYLKENYEFHSKFKYWTFIKLKNLN